MNNIEIGFEEYKLVLASFRYEKNVELAKNENGIVDENRLQELLRMEYERMLSYVKAHSAPENAQKNIEALAKRYEFVKDRRQMIYYGELKRLIDSEKYLSDQGVDKLLSNAGKVSKIGYKDAKNSKLMILKVSPKNEPQKTVKIKQIGTLGYRMINLESYIDVYKCEKNINGVDRVFTIFTDTSFQRAIDLIKKQNDGYPLTPKEETYLENVSEQLSDKHLSACQRKLNGYIGNVQNGKITYDQDEYNACRTYVNYRNRKQEEQQGR